MIAAGSKHQEVVDVDDSDLDTLITEDSSSGNSLKGDLYTTADDHNVRVDTTVGRVFVPDGYAGDTVPLSLTSQLNSLCLRRCSHLVNSEPRESRVLRANDQADVCDVSCVATCQT